MRRLSALCVILLAANALCAQTLQDAEALWKARNYRGANEIFKQNQSVLPGITVAILVIISLRDRVVPLENAHYLIDRVGSTDTTVVTLNDSAHLPTLDYDKERVQVACISFIERIARERAPSFSSQAR